MDRVVPEFGPFTFGCNVFGWTVDEARTFELLDHCFASGVRYLDTADHYITWANGGQGGESEAMIGRWLSARGHGDAVSIITKVGFPMGDGSKGLSRGHILRSIDQSLERLQRGHVEYYMAHLEDPDTPLEETIDTFAELLESGKARALAVSQFSAATIERAFNYAAGRGLPCFSAYETLYNLWDREPFESEGALVAQRHGMKVLPFRSLAAGFLTGKYRNDASVEGPRAARIRDYLSPRGMRILAALDEVATALGASVTQVAIAWLAGRPTVSTILASATTTAQIDELLAGIRLTLNADQWALLDSASEPGNDGSWTLRNG